MLRPRPMEANVYQSPLLALVYFFYPHFLQYLLASLISKRCFVVSISSRLRYAFRRVTGSFSSHVGSGELKTVAQTHPPKHTRTHMTLDFGASSLE